MTDANAAASPYSPEATAAMLPRCVVLIDEGRVARAQPDVILTILNAMT